MTGLNVTVNDLREWANNHGVEIEPWMTNPFWGGRQPGCTHCGEGGPDSDCWGEVRCHKYFNGCACSDCHTLATTYEKGEWIEVERGLSHQAPSAVLPMDVGAIPINAFLVLTEFGDFEQVGTHFSRGSHIFPVHPMTIRLSAYQQDKLKEVAGGRSIWRLSSKADGRYPDDSYRIDIAFMGDRKDWASDTC